MDRTSLSRQQDCGLTVVRGFGPSLSVDVAVVAVAREAVAKTQPITTVTEAAIATELPRLWLNLYFISRIRSRRRCTLQVSNYRVEVVFQFIEASIFSFLIWHSCYTFHSTIVLSYYITLKLFTLFTDPFCRLPVVYYRRLIRVWSSLAVIEAFQPARTPTPIAHFVRKARRCCFCYRFTAASSCIPSNNNMIQYSPVAGTEVCHRDE